MKFIIKWVLNGVIVTALLMWFADVSFWSAFITASVLTVIAYLLGDQVLLRATNNTVATIADLLLAAVYLGVVEAFYDWGLSFGEIAMISILVAAAEWVYHRYVLGQDLSVRG